MFASAICAATRSPSFCAATPARKSPERAGLALAITSLRLSKRYVCAPTEWEKLAIQILRDVLPHVRDVFLGSKRKQLILHSMGSRQFRGEMSCPGYRAACFGAGVNCFGAQKPTAS